MANGQSDQNATNMREDLAQGVATLRQWTDDLHSRVAAEGAELGPELQEALEELYVTLEELDVAADEQRDSDVRLKAAQRTVEQERQRYWDLFQHAPDGYLVTDGNGKIEEANHAAATMLSVSEGHLKGKPLATYVAQESLRTFRSLLSSLSAETSQEEHVLRITPRHGDPFQAALTVHPTPRDGDACPVSLRWQLRDITARQQLEDERANRMAEEAARAEAEAAHRSLVETLERMTDAFMAVDTDWHITYHNRVAKEIFRRVAPALSDDFEDDHLGDVLGQHCLEECDRLWNSGKSDEFEVYYPDVDLWLWVRAHPGPDGFSAHFRDITEQKHIEQLVREISTPVVEIAERVLLLPLVGEVDAERATTMTNKLLRAVSEYRALAVVIDVTGAVFTEAQDANMLVQAAQAIKLLGAESVLSGISPKTTIALTDSNIPMHDLVTVGDLRSGIERARWLARSQRSAAQNRA